MSKTFLVVYPAIMGILMVLFFTLWIVKPQHIDKVITHTIYKTVPAQFKYSVGQNVWVCDPEYNNPESDSCWFKGQIKAIQNNGNSIQYIVDDNNQVNAYDASQLASQKQ